ncbi:MAG: HD domain-containing protein [Chitinophagaceae bacterium]|jgi:2-amino-1-hydroxyethylphosphonate dioxygenase (glycine-forming)|uniref:HD domain-containing protein n=1 Tax=unclassified Paraflavitalea TaxID=2798305 RepID=UPI003D32FA9B|nr:HD domain-containing protein [Chitinophagaceae bacterium]
MDLVHAIQIADEIIGLYEKHGGNEYAGEAVTQLQHMYQSAELAREQNREADIILAAFLHDIGHICVHAEEENQMNGYGTKNHEGVGAEFLAKHAFSTRVITLVEAHVEAKRYLTWKHPEYYDQLSEASKITLSYQGGVMNSEEAAEFEQDPLFKEKVIMRHLDDEAKDPSKPVGDLSFYRRLIIQHLQQQN